MSLGDSQGRPWGSGGCSWPAELPQPRGAARARPGLGPWVAQEMADICVSDPLKRAAGMGREHPRGPCGPYTCGEPLGLLPVPSTCRSEHTPVPGVTWLPHSSQGLLCGSPIPLSHLWWTVQRRWPGRWNPRRGALATETVETCTSSSPSLRVELACGPSPLPCASVFCTQEPFGPRPEGDPSSIGDSRLQDCPD